MTEVCGGEQREAADDTVRAVPEPEHSVIRFLERKTGDALTHGGGL